MMKESEPIIMELGCMIKEPVDKVKEQVYKVKEQVQSLQIHQKVWFISNICFYYLTDYFEIFKSEDKPKVIWLEMGKAWICNLWCLTKHRRLLDVVEGRAGGMLRLYIMLMSKTYYTKVFDHFQWQLLTNLSNFHMIRQNKQLNWETYKRGEDVLVCHS